MEVSWTGRIFLHPLERERKSKYLLLGGGGVWFSVALPAQGQFGRRVRGHGVDPWRNFIYKLWIPSQGEEDYKLSGRYLRGC